MRRKETDGTRCEEAVKAQEDPSDYMKEADLVDG